MDISFYDELYGDFVQKLLEEAVDEGYHVGYLMCLEDISLLFLILLVFIYFILVIDKQFDISGKFLKKNKKSKKDSEGKSN